LGSGNGLRSTVSARLHTSAIEEIDSLGVAFEACEDRVAPESFVPGLPALANEDDLEGVFAREGQLR
jgi:hypothetical protein